MTHALMMTQPMMMTKKVHGALLRALESASRHRHSGVRLAHVYNGSEDSPRESTSAARLESAEHHDAVARCCQWAYGYPPNRHLESAHDDDDAND